MGELLNTVRHGDGAGVPLLVAHGLFGSARNWRALARRWAERRPVLCVDMRNHGASFRSDRMDYPVMAGDLAQVIAANGGVADVLGHSMGGKAAMVLALTRPEAVRRLIVGDIAPAAYGHSQMPAIEAMRGVDLARFSRRSEVQAALTEATGDPALGAFLAQSAVLDAEAPHWSLNLDALAANMEAILGFPEIEGRFEGPTLFLTGARSNYVRPEHAETVRRLFPNARHKAIAEAGHWLHADQPSAFVRAVERFLEEA